MDETEEWINFLKGKGTLHIIVDLEERIPISTSTLNDGLKKRIRLDAWELERVVDEEGDRKVYRLDSSGKNVYRGLEHNGGVEASRKAREHLATLEEVRREFIERIGEEE